MEPTVARSFSVVVLRGNFRACPQAHADDTATQLFVPYSITTSNLEVQGTVPSTIDGAANCAGLPVTSS